jgi:hypothetical protein
MRFVKPSKGFSLSKNLGMLLFYTAVVSGSLSCSKEVYALEAPSLPPSVMMASANKSNGETNTTSASKKVVKQAESKKEKVSVSSNEVKANSVSEATTKNESIKETDVAPAPVVKQVPDTEEKATLSPSTPPSLLLNSVMNQEKTSDSDEDDDFSIKGNEPKPANNLIASAKIVEKESSSSLAAAPQVKKDNSSEKKVSEKKQEVKPVEKKEVSKPAKAAVEASSSSKVEAKPAEKPMVIASAKKENINSPVQKTSAKLEVKKSVAEKETKAEVKKASKVRKVSKKIVKEEDNVCPPEWDWFSAPLVFVRDANGKLVIMADKNAPKIVIGKKASSNNDEVKTIKSIKTENKVQVKKPVIKSVKKAEPKEEEYVEAKPIEAPAAPVTNIEPQPVEEKAVVEVKEEAPEMDASDAKPVVMIKKTEPETKSMFAEAVQKMARIKRLHSYDANSNTLNVASAKRPASMVRLNKFIGQLIRRTEKNPQKDDRMLKAEVTPQAPPATNNSSVSSEEPSSEDVSSSNSAKYAFRPYINSKYSACYSKY